MNPSPGWYPDPQDRSKERYWNGSAWTTHVRNDIPRIPLAPWVEQSQHILTGGMMPDVTPPRSNRRMWIAVTAAVCGVAAATVVGVLVAIGGMGV